MRAVVFSQYGDESVLELVERPAPVPADGELLVEVRAAGVNPVDWKHREGAVRSDRPFPLGMGWDIAGVVRATVPGGPRWARRCTGCCRCRTGRPTRS